jgi:hypothetical protein
MSPAAADVKSTFLRRVTTRIGTVRNRMKRKIRIRAPRQLLQHHVPEYVPSQHSRRCTRPLPQPSAPVCRLSGRHNTARMSARITAERVRIRLKRACIRSMQGRFGLMQTRFRSERVRIRPEPVCINLKLVYIKSMQCRFRLMQTRFRPERVRIRPELVCIDLKPVRINLELVYIKSMQGRFGLMQTRFRPERVRIGPERTRIEAERACAVPRTFTRIAHDPPADRLEPPKAAAKVGTPPVRSTIRPRHNTAGVPTPLHPADVAGRCRDCLPCRSSPCRGRVERQVFGVGV